MIVTYDCVGNIHIHTRYSDGSGEIPAIAQAAQKAGLDFIIITDHHHLRGKPEEGYYGRVLVLVGSEFNLERNHYLGLNINETVPPCDEDPQQVIDGVRNQGGMGFIAHPFEIGSPIYEDGKTYPWDDWQVRGFTGIDIWSYLSQWRDASQSLPEAVYNYFNPHRAFKKGPLSDVLRQWDTLLQERMVVAIGCSDAHAIKIKLGPWQPVISDYLPCFRSINTHLILERPLTGDPVHDRTLIYSALGTGRCYVGYDFLRKSKGFRFTAESNGHRVQMGERVQARDAVLKVETPYQAKVVLIKNGRRHRVETGRNHRFVGLGAGVYRVEAYLQRCFSDCAWIFSNPIFLD